MSVEARSVTKLFGKQKALDTVSFSIKKGELVGFLGPNGAGKSTMMKIITGFLPADAGEVFVNGLQVSPESIESRKNIGYLPENNPLYTDLFVKESLEMQHKKIGALSKGYRQRVGLAQALIHDPSVLILDEPTTGLDPNQLEEIRNLIREISREKTVMLSSHIMQEVEAVCNRVIIINKGRIVADGGIAEIKTGKLKRCQVVLVEFDQNVLSEKLTALPDVKRLTTNGNLFEIESQPGIDIRPTIFKFAVDNNLTLLALNEKQQNLEGVFQELTR